jgi:hypothetical protein
MQLTANSRPQQEQEFYQQEIETSALAGGVVLLLLGLIALRT